MAGSLKTVRIQKMYPVDAEALYSAWLDEDSVRRWLAPGVMKVTELTIDGVEGGSYCLKMRDTTGAEAEVVGSIYSLVPRQRIELQWQWQGLSPAGTVKVEFYPLDKRETELRLEHGEFDTLDETQNHQNGWNVCLDKLSQFLER